MILPSSDSKGEKKEKTYCPTTWNYAYQWKYASAVCRSIEEVWSQLTSMSRMHSKHYCTVERQERSRHPNCAFAEAASTVMSGVMVSLTPLYKATIPRQIQLSGFAEFHDVKDMIKQLNDILSRPGDFPQIPPTRKECQILHFPSNKRNGQYVMCPEHECESLVYYSDQSRSMIEVLGLDHHPFWEAIESKLSMDGILSPDPRLTKDAWTWEGKDTQKWSTTKRFFQESSERSSQSSRPSRSK